MPLSSIPLPASRQATPLLGGFDFDTPTPSPLAHKRHSLTIQVPASEPLIAPKALPRSRAEWKTTLAEIKRDYISRRFRACYTRCSELLAGNDDQPIENAHLLYVRFYAASALEMQVRALQQNSSYRTKLLLEAREHYRAASDLAAAENASKRRRPSSRAFSPAPSLHSPSGCGSSRFNSPPASRVPSPSPSVTSLDSCLKSNISAPKPKKRVAFIGVPAYEPIVRPDSPTLGFDDWLSPPASPAPVVVAAPRPVAVHSIHTSSLPTISLPSPTLSVSSTDSMLSSSLLSSPSSDFDESDVDCFFQERSTHQYCTVLSSLQRQISSHISWLDQDIAAALAPQPPAIMTDEMRSLEIRTRIERLRANGWKRQRFDASRYEALRESALADII